MEPFKVGDVLLNKYEITGILGKGGMGLVLAARHRELHDFVALKFLLPALREKMELTARFLREARTASRIKNQHVARVFDVSMVDGVPFMVMEHLMGEDLGAMMRKRGPLSIAETADLLLQTCEALQEAHMLGIVHRDLKPGNLFVVTAPDGTPFIKVLDFGISKTTSLDDVSATASREVLGSPLYMSPEQLSSARSVDARSDIWSLGVILYEMLAGTPPFAGETFPVVCAAILNGSYAPLAKQRPDVPAELEAMLGETLARDREVRIATVETLAARLAPFGTAAARASDARIQRIAQRAQALSTPDRAIDDPESSGSPPANVPTQVGHATTGDFSPPRDSRPSLRKRWIVGLGIGVVAAAAVGAATLRSAATSTTTPASAVSSPIVPGAPGAASSATLVPACASGATPACESACADQRPGSCEALGSALERGIGAARDLARAGVLYTTACDAGSLSACNHLGALYGRGDGVARDDTKAIELYTRACNGGVALACVNLGAMHFNGSGVPKNEALGARFFSRGCEGGAPLGCFNVSIAYAGGNGVPKDLEQALAFADRACKGGAFAGCARLGLAKITGEGTPKDVKAGLAQLDELCTRGQPVGCESLAGLYGRGRVADVPADPVRLREYAKKACDLGSQQSCDLKKGLGTIDDSDSELAQANALLQTQCETGSYAACGMLGENLLGGLGASVDRAKGRALLEKACVGGFDRACKRLADAGVQ